MEIFATLKNINNGRYVLALYFQKPTGLILEI